MRKPSYIDPKSGTRDLNPEPEAPKAPVLPNAPVPATVGAVGFEPTAFWSRTRRAPKCTSPRKFTNSDHQNHDHVRVKERNLRISLGEIQSPTIIFSVLTKNSHSPYCPLICFLLIYTAGRLDEEQPHGGGYTNGKPTKDVCRHRHILSRFFL